MEDPKKRNTYKLVRDEKVLCKLIKKAEFSSLVPISEKTILLKEMKKKVVLDKPLQIGIALLDNAKGI